MKSYGKFIQGLMLQAFVMVVCTVHAQPHSVFEVKPQLGIKTIIDQKCLFLEEENPLMCDENLYCIETDADSVVVGALVCNETSNKDGRGDYSTYWKGKKETANRYTWVFIPENFIKVCFSKSIFKNCTSERLCKLLGLGTDVQRDTIVYMKVPKDSLFRPAYVTDISQKLEDKDKGNNENINRLDEPRKEWMVGQQITNSYPWTRMGYTYDWGDANGNYIGVTEFIIRPKTKYSDLDYITIDKIQSKKGLWPGKLDSPNIGK